MSSITIHNIDKDLDLLIRKKAKKEGVSLNKTIQKALRESFNLETESDKNKKESFADIFGCWTEDDYREFTKKTKDFNKIDTEDWQ